MYEAQLSVVSDGRSVKKIIISRFVVNSIAYVATIILAFNLLGDFIGLLTAMFIFLLIGDLIHLSIIISIVRQRNRILQIQISMNIASTQIMAA